VSDTIAKVKSGDFAPVDVETIASAGAVQAIPTLKEQFARSNDWLIKAKLASALVRLGGDQDDIYREFLVKQATIAIESDAPDFMNFDPQAKDSAGPSPAFVAWADAHKLDAQEAGGDAMLWFPARLRLLASSGDRRAIPLRLRGHRKTGQRWSLQNRPTESGLGLGCFTPTPPVEASLFSCANSVDHI
jgi:hypothetical protein